MFIIILSLASIMYIFLRFISSFVNNPRVIYCKANLLWGILDCQNLLNREILYFDSIISVLLAMGVISYYFLSASSNHLVLSLDILAIFAGLIILKNKTVKISEALPLV